MYQNVSGISLSSPFSPYSSFAFMLRLPVLGLYGIPETVNEWVSVSMLVSSAFSRGLFLLSALPL